jgi:O-acetyl-ADP-ribose deacetylase (regulator of RNase III)
MKFGDSILELKIGDITLEDTDAIVNAANSSLMGGGGVDGAIHKRGGEIVHKECLEIIKEIGNLNPGYAVITSGGNLKAKYVIHTVGPVWYGGDSGEEKILRSAYRKSLELAFSKNIKSISFPSISTGAYGYPVKEASYIALSEIIDFLKNYKTPPPVTTDSTSTMPFIPVENGAIIAIPPISLVRFVLYDEDTYSVYKGTGTFFNFLNNK